MEVISTILIGVMLGIAVTIIFEFILKTNKWLWHRYYKRHLVVCGYHIHHSTYGLLFIIAGIYFFFEQNFADALSFVCFGLGIITQHTISARGRLVFIEKWWK